MLPRAQVEIRIGLPARLKKAFLVPLRNIMIISRLRHLRSARSLGSSALVRLRPACLDPHSTNVRLAEEVVLDGTCREGQTPAICNTPGRLAVAGFAPQVTCRVSAEAFSAHPFSPLAQRGSQDGLGDRPRPRGSSPDRSPCPSPASRARRGVRRGRRNLSEKQNSC